MPNPNHTPWSTEELANLRLAYEVWPPRYDLVAGRTRTSVHQKAYRLGLTNRAGVGRQFDHVTDTEWAYLAAFIDGEGTINIGRDTNRVSVLVVNTHVPVMDWIHVKWPNGYYLVRRFQPNDKVGRTKPIVSLAWTRTAVVEELLSGMLPYLIVKKDKAEAGIQLCQATKFVLAAKKAEAA